MDRINLQKITSGIKWRETFESVPFFFEDQLACMAIVSLLRCMKANPRKSNDSLKQNTFASMCISGNTDRQKASKCTQKRNKIHKIFQALPKEGKSEW